MSEEADDPLAWTFSAVIGVRGQATNARTAKVLGGRTDLLHDEAARKTLLNASRKAMSRTDALGKF